MTTGRPIPSSIALKSTGVDGNASNAYIAVMATLTIRNFPDELRDRLRVRAAEHGRSMEAEARQMLTHGLNEQMRPSDDTTHALEDIQNWVASHVRGQRPIGATSELIRDRRREAILEIIADKRDPAEVLGAQFDRICREAGWTKQHVRSLTGGTE